MKSRNWKGWAIAGAAVALMWMPLAASGQTTGGPYQFYTVTPCRLVDSRSNLGATVLTGGVTQNVSVKSRCGVSATAKAVVLNVTVVGPTADGFLVLWAAGTSLSGTSNINFRAGEPALANGAIVSLGGSVPDLSIIYGSAGPGTTHFILDIVGYFQ